MSDIEIQELRERLANVQNFCKTHPKLTYGDTAKWNDLTLQYLVECWSFFRKLDALVPKEVQS